MTVPRTPEQLADVILAETRYSNAQPDLGKSWRVKDAVRELLALLQAAERERDRAMDAAESAVEAGNTATRGWEAAEARVKEQDVVIEAGRQLRRRVGELDDRANDWGRLREAAAWDDAIEAYDAVVSRGTPEAKETGE